MRNLKSPFKNFTLEEIQRAESNSFVIQIGNDFYNKNGDFTFTIGQAEKYYEILLENILITLDEGTPKQKKAALSCLARLHILPLRLQ
jgi:hypothetical protein